MGYYTNTYNGYNRYEDYKKNSFAFAGNRNSTSKCNPVIIAAVVIFTVIIAMFAGLKFAPDVDKAPAGGSAAACVAVEDSAEIHSYC